VTSNLFAVMKLLESRGAYFDVRRLSPSDVTLLVTLVGRRVEIRVDEDDTIDVCVFEGDEAVELGMEAVLRALDEDTPWPMRRPPRDESVVATMLANDALVSAQTALVLFRAVVAERRGADVLAAQEPIRVEDGRNLWSVVGAGGIAMSITKLDGAIVSLTG